MSSRHLRSEYLHAGERNAGRTGSDRPKKAEVEREWEWALRSCKRTNTQDLRPMGVSLYIRLCTLVCVSPDAKARATTDDAHCELPRTGHRRFSRGKILCRFLFFFIILVYTLYVPVLSFQVWSLESKVKSSVVNKNFCRLAKAKLLNEKFIWIVY